MALMPEHDVIGTTSIDHDVCTGVDEYGLNKAMRISTFESASQGGSEDMV